MIALVYNSFFCLARSSYSYVMGKGVISNEEPSIHATAREQQNITYGNYSKRNYRNLSEIKNELL